MANKKVFWTGELEDSCQLCNKPFGYTMYDSVTPSGLWGNICDRCFGRYGGRIGTGFGQKYELQDDKRWLKVEG